MPDPVSAYQADIERAQGEQLRTYRITFRVLREESREKGLEATEAAKKEWGGEPAAVSFLLERFVEALAEPEHTVTVRALNPRQAADILATMVARAELLPFGFLHLLSVQDLGASWAGDGAAL